MKRLKTLNRTNSSNTPWNHSKTWREFDVPYNYRSIPLPQQRVKWLCIIVIRRVKVGVSFQEMREMVYSNISFWTRHIKINFNRWLKHTKRTLFKIWPKRDTTSASRDAPNPSRLGVCAQSHPARFSKKCRRERERKMNQSRVDKKIKISTKVNVPCALEFHNQETPLIKLNWIKYL